MRLRLFLALAVLAFSLLAFEPAEATTPDDGRISSTVTAEVVQARASVAHDICLWIIRSSHPRDLIRTAVFVLTGQVYCSAFHYYLSGGIWRPNGWCHEFDYFPKTNTVDHDEPRRC